MARYCQRCNQQNVSCIPEKILILFFLKPESIVYLLIIIKISQLSKNYNTIPQMDKQSTPFGQSFTLQFDGFIMLLAEYTIGKINIQFDQLDNKLHYEVISHELTKINFKTIIAGLKGTHPQIIKAALNKTQDSNYQLIVTVSYQFLPEIKEVIKFTKRQIAQEQTQQIATKNMRNHIRQLKDQINSLGTISLMYGKLQENSDTQIYANLRHKKTVFTLGLTFTKVYSNMLKLQMYYYNSTTKHQKTSGSMPQEGIYLHHNNGNCYAEIKFYAQMQDYDMVLFKITEKQTGEYTLSSQKVEVL